MLKLKVGVGVKETQFSKDQDLLLLQQAVAVRPFSQGKGQGWKMIANKLMKLDHFPITVKPRIVRERILLLMDNFSPNDSGDASDSNTTEMDELLKQLVDLREEAMKMVKHLTGNSIYRDTQEESRDLTTNQEKQQPYVSGKETKYLESVKNEKEERIQTETKASNVQKKVPVKRKYQRQPKTITKTTNLNVINFLEEREVKRLKIREEELALRREELEERKRMVELLEERFEEEKRIREQLFELLKK